MPRWASRTDDNHSDLLATLRGLGWKMKSTHQLPDWVDAVGFHVRHGLTLFEFKVEDGPLTSSQEALLADGWPIVVIRSADDAIAFTVRRS